MKEQYLAADLGSSNGKILLSALTDRKTIEMREVGRFPTPRIYMNGHVCIDVYGIYGEICRALERLGREGVTIRSFGADSWSSDFGIVDPQGELAGLPVFYRDKRTNGMPEEVEKKISYRDLYELTTQRRIQDATLCQLLAVKKENPELLQNGNRMMHLGDILMYFFSGKVCSEFSVASYSQMFNMRNQCWEDRVFDLFGIPKSLQPPVVHAGACLGRISEEHARWCGTNRFEVVAPAVHDTSSAGVAVPVDGRKDWAYISTGSWYLVSMELEEPADSGLSYHYNLSNTGLAFGKTLLKRNVCAMWILQECKRKWEQIMGVDYDYPAIVELARSAVPFYAVIDTDDSCFYNPDDMTEAVADYLRRTGQPEVQRDDVGQMARIIYESITFKCLYSLDALKRTTGRRVDTLYVVGGASGVGFLNEMLASAADLEVIAGPKEAAAIGNSLLQAVGTGALDSEEEVREVVRNSFKLETYYPKRAEEWRRYYRAFLDVCGLEQ